MRTLGTLFLMACAGPPEATFVAAGEQELVVFIALPGRELSDRMEKTALRDPRVLDAMRRHGYAPVRIDGFREATRYAEWIGSGEGMGIVVLDRQRRVAAARAGPQDAPELAAFLDQAARMRGALEQARRSGDARMLAPILLELGCRREAEPLLRRAATAGDPTAALQLALLLGQDGRLAEARRWLGHAEPGPETAVVAGYLSFKERRHAEAVAILSSVPGSAVPPRERWRAALYRGKALHECGRSAEAVRVLQILTKDARGTTFAGAALHTLDHIHSADHGHAH